MKKMLYTPENSNGVLVDYTALEIEQHNLDIANEISPFDKSMKILRQTRNNLLAETDWMANSDVTMSEAMTTYRQALRDLTNGLDTVEKVEAVEFPTKPSGE